MTSLLRIHGLCEACGSKDRPIVACDAYDVNEWYVRGSDRADDDDVCQGGAVLLGVEQHLHFARLAHNHPQLR